MWSNINDKYHEVVKSLNHVRLFVTPWTVAHQAPPSMKFSRQEYWSGVPLPSPIVQLLWKQYEYSSKFKHRITISSFQLLSCVRLLATPWTVARQGSLSFTNSWSLLRLISIELVMPSNRLILCHPLLLLPSIFPSIRVFSNKLTLHIGWPK